MATLYKKKQSVTDKKTGKKVVTESKKWWCRYKDSLDITRYKALSSDLKTAQKMLNKIMAKVEKEKAGLIDPTEEEMRKPILIHLEAYELHLKARNNTARYIMESVRRVKRFIVPILGYKNPRLQAINCYRVCLESCVEILLDLNCENGLHWGTQQVSGCNCVPNCWLSADCGTHRLFRRWYDSVTNWKSVPSMRSRPRRSRSSS